jgi:GxxExxY protein
VPQWQLVQNDFTAEKEESTRGKNKTGEDSVDARSIMKTAAELNALSERIIGAGIAVHRELGPGLLESAYEACLEYELIESGLFVERQVALPVYYRSTKVEAGFRIDLFVEKTVIVELKAVERFERIHEAQLQTYLKLTRLNLGLLMNFNTLRLIDGIKRVVRDFPDL